MFAASKTASVSGGYQISRSLRFNPDDSAYLNRTPASATNRKTWTFSTWIKRSKLTGSSGNTDINCVFTAYSDTSNYLAMDFATTSTNAFAVSNSSAGIINAQLVTTATYRDPSAWYHFVVSVDTTQATASNRIKIYVNGVEVTALSTATYPSQNTDLQINNNVLHQLGRNPYPSYPQNYDGYMTEVNFIDGQALTPSSFGETNVQTGVWQPKAYSGSYGTNGFYLNFSDNSNTTAATLGADSSGNGNNWTPNNFSVTAGAGNDSLVDVPTPYGVDTGAGGSVRGNYCTFNPLDKNSSLVVTNGNLNVTDSTGGWLNGRCTIGMSSGKWYFESTVTSGPYQVVGIANSLTINTGYQGGSVVGNWAYSSDGAKILDGVYSPPYGASFTTNDVIGVAFDADTGTLTMYKNGTSQGTLVSGLPANTYFPWVATLSSTVSFNFGQRPFAYTAPSGFKALCTQNLPTPTIGATTATQANKYFNIKLYTGNGSAGNAQSGLGFQPDFLWFKSRSAARSHGLFNAVMTRTFGLASESTNAEYTSAAGRDLASFDSDGFTVGVPENFNSTNASGDSIVAWAWKANGSGSSNTSGTITSTVSASTASGFSVVTYTGTGANATVGHGLGAVPSMIIVKCRNASGDIWPVYNVSIGNTKYLRLNGTNLAATFNSWQDTTPTSTVFYISTDTVVNTNGNTYVAYCFAPIAGYSAIGSYTGNGSADGPFIYTGFRPAFVMIKSTSFSEDWTILDATRNPYNVADEILKPNTSDSTYVFSIEDFVSNGFKLRSTGSLTNSSGNTYIYMAFAQNPFKYSLAR